MLGSFLKLGYDAAANGSIADYAGRWGLLGLCEHGVPGGHHENRVGGIRCPRRVEAGWALESIDHWRSLARQAMAMCAIARAMKDGQGVGTPEDWKGLGHANWRVGMPQMNLDAAVNRWLALGEVAPRRRSLNATGTRATVPGVVLAANGLFGALAIQILVVVNNVSSGVDLLTPCSEPGCENLALPARKGLPPYCGEHLAKGRNRDRGARFRGSNPDYYSRARRAERHGHKNLTTPTDWRATTS